MMIWKMSFSDTDISHINSFVANFISKFSEQFRFYVTVGLAWIGFNLLRIDYLEQLMEK